MILAIESSCDDSSLAIMQMKNFKLEFHEKISQEEAHSEFGGVVPELAARLHTAALPKLIEKASPYFDRLKAIAVTNEPGLSVSLLGGVCAAKTLALALNLPLIAVNHLIGHIYSLFLDKNGSFPMGVLLVSGGHTMVLDVGEDGAVTLLATTSDDSFGESFDKCAKMMNLGYPGGAVIEKAAKFGDKNRFKFTVPLKGDPRMMYSFSGLKNQARLCILNHPNLNDQDIADIAYAFQKAACEHIIDKLGLIFAQKKWEKFGVVGGASANLHLRSLIQNLCDKFDAKLLLAPLEFCSDNALMIARAGVEKYKRGEFTAVDDIKIKPCAKIERI